MQKSEMTYIDQNTPLWLTIWWQTSTCNRALVECVSRIAIVNLAAIL